ncbi:NADPH-dependent 1-acyl dihydroxyacetone phosphate reductase [Sporothrix bragantina]|uniref:NADPH-dependent 1-acyl dihydroxyacetone phosphate reductase n=1 Tax=Sporothrix bragantina TaxID=671064 RepID=A0ABP0B543_9PEZI
MSEVAIRAGQKSVLITGCTPGGIGHAIAEEFHSKGVFVIATARRPEVLKELAAKGMATVALDVTSQESIAQCKEEVTKLTGGRLDFLVNNAGRTHTVPATDLDIDEIRATFETNVFGVMAMCKSFVSLLINARGLIINIASLSATSPYIFGSSYCASKGAVVSYSRCLRQELRPFGVRVTVVMAGTVRSNIANTVHPLVEGSLYEPVADLYAKRQVYSQNNQTMETPVFAQKVVANALRPEVPLLLRAWMGRRDWFWCGGMSTIVWLGTILGEWILDAGAYRMFGLQKLKIYLDLMRRNKEAQAKKDAAKEE